MTDPVPHGNTTTTIASQPQDDDMAEPVPAYPVFEGPAPSPADSTDQAVAASADLPDDDMVDADYGEADDEDVKMETEDSNKCKS